MKSKTDKKIDKIMIYNKSYPLARHIVEQLVTKDALLEKLMDMGKDLNDVIWELIAISKEVEKKR